jgi:hypothetical protein
VIVENEARVAWRIWRLGAVALPDGASEVFLRSCVRSGYWEARARFEASCSRHKLPDLRCECGIYAVRERAQAEEWATWARSVLPNPIVMGRVSLWGKVLQFSKGFRAQYAYPYELEVARDGDWDGLDAEEVARQLRDAYLVDMVMRPPTYA